jgi:uncharacterized membrane protein
MPRPGAQAAANGTTRPKVEPKADAQREPAARSVEEITERNIGSIRRLESIEHRRRGKLDRIADRVSEFAGSTGFLLVHVLWFGAWIAYNAWPGIDAFDPYPFTFLTFVVSLEAIFLSTFILISQTRAARISDHRNQLDLQINLLTEQENTEMLILMERRAAKLGIDGYPDANLRALEQPTRLEKLARQIESAERRAGAPARPTGNGGLKKGR